MVICCRLVRRRDPYAEAAEMRGLGPDKLCAVSPMDVGIEGAYLAVSGASVRASEISSAFAQES